MNLDPGPPALSELRVGNRFRLGKKIGRGSFGDIYKGTYIVIICTQMFTLSRRKRADE
jgi:hypothetical protein